MAFGIVVTTTLVMIVFAWALCVIMARHEEREGVREPMLIPVNPVAPLTRTQVEIVNQLLINEAQESYRIAAEETDDQVDADQQRAYGDACLEIRELLWRAQPDERQGVACWN